MLEYDVLCADNLRDLIADVNARVADGWEPLGGVAVRVEDSDGVLSDATRIYWYFQAMTRGGRDEKPLGILGKDWRLAAMSLGGK